MFLPYYVGPSSDMIFDYFGTSYPSSPFLLCFFQSKAAKTRQLKIPLDLDDQISWIAVCVFFEIVFFVDRVSEVFF